MSKKKKHKKNKKSFANQNQNKSTSNVSAGATEDLKLIADPDDVTKLENKPVDLIDHGTVSDVELKTDIETNSESSNLKLDFGNETKDTIDEVLEEKLKHDLETEGGVTLEHKSVKDETEDTDNGIPKSFWVGLIIGALLMSFVV